MIWTSTSRMARRDQLTSWNSWLERKLTLWIMVLKDWVNWTKKSKRINCNTLRTTSFLQFSWSSLLNLNCKRPIKPFLTTLILKNREDTLDLPRMTLFGRIWVWQRPKDVPKSLLPQPFWRWWSFSGVFQWLWLVLSLTLTILQRRFTFWDSLTTCQRKSWVLLPDFFQLLHWRFWCH